MWWFRPPIRCTSPFDVWLLTWDWIGRAYTEQWYYPDILARQLHESRNT